MTGMAVQDAHLPQEPQLGQQRGVLLGFLRGGLGRLLVLQTEALNLLQDLSRQVGERDGHVTLHSGLFLSLSC